MENYFYQYDRFNRSFEKSQDFSPSFNNWMVKASNEQQTLYFPNLGSYNHWANTCCGQSYQYIREGQYNGYDLSLNPRRP